MAAPPRPLPTPDHESAEFWRRVGSHTLALQRCLACRAFRFYPRALCPECLSDRTEWVAASGRGAVYSFTVCHRPASEAFAAMTPYVVALVDLAEGVRLLTNLVDCSPDDVRVGMPVKVVYEDIPDGATLYKVAPVRP